MKQKERSYDVIISGAGFVGSLLALALDQNGFTVLLIDHQDWFEKKIDADGRASAIAPDCWNLLAALNLGETLEGKSQQIQAMQVDQAVVGHNKVDFALCFDGKEESGQSLGWMIENHELRKALNELLKRSKTLDFAPGTKITEFDVKEPFGSLKLSNGCGVTAKLVVSAEGRKSALRQAAGIGIEEAAYDQAGIVCTINHELPHEGLAFQWFLPNGPIAFLPLPAKDQTAHRSSIVWSEKRELADAFMALDQRDFADQVQRRFGPRLGSLTLNGDRWSFPLSASIADHFTSPRLALIGDAAHGIHPLAGQGLNLGIRDVAVLAEVLVDARRLGLDFGTQLILQKYERWRRFDSSLALGLVDGLNKLFTTSFAPAKFLAANGLPIVNRIEGLKSFLINKAAGISPNQPALLKGEPI